jgi:hypothetical protein
MVSLAEPDACFGLLDSFDIIRELFSTMLMVGE